MRRSISALIGLFVALNSIPSSVSAYDCSRVNRGDCTQDSGVDPLVGFSTCMVAKYSVSVFIQCASQPNPPVFTAPPAPDSNDHPRKISTLDILTKAASTPAASICVITINIKKAARLHGSTPFATFLCKYHVIDQGPNHTGICCLRNALKVSSREHSIQSVCDGKEDDLMNAPKLPDSCGSSEDQSNSDGGGSSAAASTNDSPLTVVSTSPSSDSTQTAASSAASTHSPMADSATSATATGASSTPQAPQSTSGASGRRGALLESLQRLGLIVLPLMAVF